MRPCLGRDRQKYLFRSRGLASVPSDPRLYSGDHRHASTTKDCEIQSAVIVGVTFPIGFTQRSSWGPCASRAGGPCWGRECEPFESPDRPPPGDHRSFR